jgi:AmmeMemoRadiSam system protein B
MKNGGPKLRRPAVAGTFYPGDGADLARLVENCFTGSRGPGQLPARHRSPDRHLRAIVVPHAGYIYSGPIAAHAYAAVATERPPESVLILGVNHRGRGAPAALSGVDWATPLGTVPVDSGLLQELTKGPIEVDESAHALEHSIEVELPFLQYVLPHPKFVALSLSTGTLGFLTDVAAVIRKAIRGRDILLVVSTDFSHYVPAREAERLDRMAIEEILRRSADGLYTTVLNADISMCGVAPTTVLLSTLEGESLTAKLLRWGHSGESEPMAEVVGYASLLLESGPPLSAPQPFQKSAFAP